MPDYPSISLAKVRTLLNGSLTRRNVGRPGNSDDPEKSAKSKRVYGPQPGNEDVATLLFYRSAYPKREDITQFFEKNDLKAGAPVETTPAFYRYRIHKVANFDKNSLKTFRLNEAPDVLVITGVRLSEEQRKGKKASSLEFRVKTLRAAGWNVTADADRKRAQADADRARDALASLEERLNEKTAVVRKADISAYARVRTALRKKAGNNTAFTEEEARRDAETPNKSVGKRKIYEVLIQDARERVKEAEKRASKIAAPPAGKRALPEGITDEMLANYQNLQKLFIKPEYRKSAGEIRSFATNKTGEFLSDLTKWREADLREGGTGAGTGSRTTSRPSDTATATAAEEGEVTLPRRGAQVAPDVLEKVTALAKKALQKHAKTQAKANVDKGVAFLVNVMKQAEVTDPADVAEDAEDMGKAAAAMKEAGVSFADATLAEIVNYLPTSGEPETQENPRRRPSARRTTSLVKRTPQKWAAIEKAQRRSHTIAEDINDAEVNLSKTKALLARLKGKRTSQATYARQQLQAEVTRITRRIAKLNKDLVRAHKAVISAVKAANKKPTNKRRSR